MLKSIDRILLFILILLLQSFFPPRVSAINFSANYHYSELGGKNRNTQSSLQQRYQLGVGKGLAYRASNQLLATAGVGYTTSQQRAGGGTYKYQTLSPRFGLNVLNDIFSAQFADSIAMSQVNPPSGAITRFTRNSWQASLNSVWDEPYIPVLSFGMGEGSNTSALLDRSATTTNKNRNMSLDWDLELAHIYYSYSDNIGISDSGNQSETKGNYVKFDTGGGIWKNRLGYSFSEQYQTVTSEVTINGQSGTTLLTTLGGQAEALVTDPLAIPDPFTSPDLVDVVLLPNGALRDQELNVAALSVPADQRVALGMKFNYPQQINILQITVTDPLTSIQAEAMTWSLYIKNTSGPGWKLASSTITSSYDGTKKRFTLTINQSSAEIMVVAINNTGFQLGFAEIEALSESAMSFRSTGSEEQTNAGLHFNPIKSVSSSLSYYRVHDKTQGVAGFSNENNQQTIAAMIGWAITPQVTPTFSASQTQISSTGNLDQMSRSYSFNIASTPMKTIHVAFAANQGEAYVEDRKTALSHNYHLITTALVYPDLNTALFLSTGDSKTFGSDGQVVGQSSSFAGRWTIVARLRPTVTANFTGNYGSNKNNGIASPTSSTGLFFLRYGPSDYLSLTGSYSTRFSGGPSADKYGLSLFLAVLRTSKITLDMNGTYSLSEGRSGEGLSYNGSWKISRHISLTSTGNMAFGANWTYSYQALLRLSF